MNGTDERCKTKAKARLALTPLSSTHRLITPILLIRPIRPICHTYLNLYHKVLTPFPIIHVILPSA